MASEVEQEKFFNEEFKDEIPEPEPNPEIEPDENELENLDAVFLEGSKLLHQILPPK